MLEEESNNVMAMQSVKGREGKGKERKGNFDIKQNPPYAAPPTPRSPLSLTRTRTRTEHINSPAPYYNPSNLIKPLSRTIRL